jgi:hypothetical protein
MVRRRDFKSLKPDLPPFRPLLPDEVKRIAHAGGIAFHGPSDSARQFEQALDYIRNVYWEGLKAKQFGLTDLQIADRLKEARDLAVRLRELLGDGALLSKTVLVEYKAWLDLEQFPRNIVEPLHLVVRWAECGLSELAERSRVRPNVYAFSSATNPALPIVLTDLVHVWRVATGTANVSEKSRLISFLSEAVRVITQSPVNPDSAKKRAGKHVRRDASRPIDRGYFPDPRGYDPNWKPF